MRGVTEGGLVAAVLREDPRSTIAPRKDLIMQNNLVD